MEHISMEFWLFITAVLFTLVGWYMARKKHFEDCVTATVDSLIKDGYIKTQGSGNNMEILTAEEWIESCKNTTD